MNFDGNFNLENYSAFEFKFKAQASDIKSWKIVLKTSDSIDRFTSYQQDFEVRICMSPSFLYSWSLSHICIGRFWTSAAKAVNSFFFNLAI